MKTLILIAMLSLSACASTPSEPDFAKPWELYAQQMAPEPMSLWDIFVKGMARAMQVEEARRISNPAFRCYTYGRVTTCNPQ